MATLAAVFRAAMPNAPSFPEWMSDTGLRQVYAYVVTTNQVTTSTGVQIDLGSVAGSALDRFVFVTCTRKTTVYFGVFGSGQTVNIPRAGALVGMTSPASPYAEMWWATTDASAANPDVVQVAVFALEA